MFFLKKQRSRPKKGIRNDFLSSSPSLLPVRDLLGLYDLPEDLITAGALCDAFLGGEISRSGYEAWKKTLNNTYDNRVCDLVVSALETGFTSVDKKDFDVFVLKSAILINKISKLASLSESEVSKWTSEMRCFAESAKKMNFQPSYKDACQDMETYLRDAFSCISEATL